MDDRKLSSTLSNQLHDRFTGMIKEDSSRLDSFLKNILLSIIKDERDYTTFKEHIIVNEQEVAAKCDEIWSLSDVTLISESSKKGECNYRIEKKVQKCHLKRNLYDSWNKMFREKNEQLSTVVLNNRVAFKTAAAFLLSFVAFNVLPDDIPLNGELKTTEEIEHALREDSQRTSGERLSLICATFSTIIDVITNNCEKLVPSGSQAYWIFMHCLEVLGRKICFHEKTRDRTFILRQIVTLPRGLITDPLIDCVVVDLTASKNRLENDGSVLGFLQLLEVLVGCKACWTAQLKNLVKSRISEIGSLNVLDFGSETEVSHTLTVENMVKILEKFDFTGWFQLMSKNPLFVKRNPSEEELVLGELEKVLLRVGKCVRLLRTLARDHPFAEYSAVTEMCIVTICDLLKKSGEFARDVTNTLGIGHGPGKDSELPEAFDRVNQIYLTIATGFLLNSVNNLMTKCLLQLQFDFCRYLPSSSLKPVADNLLLMVKVAEHCATKATVNAIMIRLMYRLLKETDAHHVEFITHQFLAVFDLCVLENKLEDLEGASVELEQLLNTHHFLPSVLLNHILKQPQVIGQKCRQMCALVFKNPWCPSLHELNDLFLWIDNIDVKSVNNQFGLAQILLENLFKAGFQHVVRPTNHIRVVHAFALYLCRLYKRIAESVKDEKHGKNTLDVLCTWTWNMLLGLGLGSDCWKSTEKLVTVPCVKKSSVFYDLLVEANHHAWPYPCHEPPLSYLMNEKAPLRSIGIYVCTFLTNCFQLKTGSDTANKEDLKSMIEYLSKIQPIKKDKYSAEAHLLCLIQVISVQFNDKKDHENKLPPALTTVLEKLLKRDPSKIASSIIRKHYQLITVSPNAAFFISWVNLLLVNLNKGKACIAAVLNLLAERALMDERMHHTLQKTLFTYLRSAMNKGMEKVKKTRTMTLFGTKREWEGGLETLPMHSNVYFYYFFKLAKGDCWTGVDGETTPTQNMRNAMTFKIREWFTYIQLVAPSHCINVLLWYLFFKDYLILKKTYSVSLSTCAENDAFILKSSVVQSLERLVNEMSLHDQQESDYYVFLRNLVQQGEDIDVEDFTSKCQWFFAELKKKNRLVFHFDESNCNQGNIQCVSRREYTSSCFAKPFFDLVYKYCDQRVIKTCFQVLQSAVMFMEDSTKPKAERLSKFIIQFANALPNAVAEWNASVLKIEELALAYHNVICNAMLELYHNKEMEDIFHVFTNSKVLSYELKSGPNYGKIMVSLSCCKSPSCKCSETLSIKYENFIYSKEKMELIRKKCSTLAKLIDQFDSMEGFSSLIECVCCVKILQFHLRYLVKNNLVAGATSVISDTMLQFIFALSENLETNSKTHSIFVERFIRNFISNIGSTMVEFEQGDSLQTTLVNKLVQCDAFGFQILMDFVRLKDDESCIAVYKAVINSTLNLFVKFEECNTSLIELHLSLLIKNDIQQWPNFLTERNAAIFDSIFDTYICILKTSLDKLPFFKLDFVSSLLLEGVKLISAQKAAYKRSSFYEKFVSSILLLAKKQMIGDIIWQHIFALANAKMARKMLGEMYIPPYLMNAVFQHKVLRDEDQRLIQLIISCISSQLEQQDEAAIVALNNVGKMLDLYRLLNYGMYGYYFSDVLHDQKFSVFRIIWDFFKPLIMLHIKWVGEHKWLEDNSTVVAKAQHLFIDCINVTCEKINKINKSYVRLLSDLFLSMVEIMNAPQVKESQPLRLHYFQLFRSVTWNHYEFDETQAELMSGLSYSSESSALVLVIITNILGKQRHLESAQLLFSEAMKNVFYFFVQKDSKYHPLVQDFINETTNLPTFSISKCKLEQISEMIADFTEETGVFFTSSTLQHQWLASLQPAATLMHPTKDTIGEHLLKVKTYYSLMNRFLARLSDASIASGGFLPNLKLYFNSSIDDFHNIVKGISSSDKEIESAQKEACCCLLEIFFIAKKSKQFENSIVEDFQHFIQKLKNLKFCWVLWNSFVSLMTFPRLVEHSWLISTGEGLILSLLKNKKDGFFALWQQLAERMETSELVLSCEMPFKQGFSTTNYLFLSLLMDATLIRWKQCVATEDRHSFLQALHPLIAELAFPEVDMREQCMLKLLHSYLLLVIYDRYEREDDNYYNLDAFLQTFRRFCSKKHAKVANRRLSAKLKAGAISLCVPLAMVLSHFSTDLTKEKAKLYKKYDCTKIDKKIRSCRDKLVKPLYAAVRPSKGQKCSDFSEFSDLNLKILDQINSLLFTNSSFSN